MNSVQLIGRIASDLNLNITGENKWTRFNLAVQRGKKNKEGQYEADFITITAWNKPAELIVEYHKKGDLLGLEGTIRTGSYEKDGKTIYTTEILVNRLHFLPNKAKEETKSEAKDIPVPF